MASETVNNDPVDVMLDIETMALTPDALILSIGAVCFTPRHPHLVFGDTFLMVPSFMGQVLNGRRIDPDTQKWWGDPEREAAAEHWMCPAQPNTLAAVLVKLSDFIRINKPERVWANGAVFDIGILEHAYRSKGLVIPWKYNQVRDSRTIRQEIPMLAERTVTETYVPVGEPAHHPITDCKVQIKDLWIRGF